MAERVVGLLKVEMDSLPAAVAPQVVDRTLESLFGDSWVGASGWGFVPQVEFAEIAEQLPTEHSKTKLPIATTNPTRMSDDA